MQIFQTNKMYLKLGFYPYNTINIFIINMCLVWLFVTDSDICENSVIFNQIRHLWIFSFGVNNLILAMHAAIFCLIRSMLNIFIKLSNFKKW